MAENSERMECEAMRKLFVGGLNRDTTDETKLDEYFSQWGKVEEKVIIKDEETKVSRGFGFVTYANHAMVDEALKKRYSWIKGRKVREGMSDWE